jgi:predicted PurR-regulated permease PerM
MEHFNQDKIRQLAAISIMGILGLFLLFTLSGFISSFLGAVIFYIICAPFLHYVLVKTKIKRGLAVMLVLLLSFLVIVIPVFGLTWLLVSKISIFFTDSQSIYNQVIAWNEYVNVTYGFNLLTADNLVKMQAFVTNLIPNILGGTMTILAEIAMMYFILFYLLYTETDIEKQISKVLPFKMDNARLFAAELRSQTYSNVIGAPLLALIQGCFAATGFWIFGLHEPLFWGLMCGFLSFIPFVGSALVWVPAGMAQLSAGATWQGTAILIYGLVVIINIDNVFRFVLQKRFADVHPLITILGVIVGFNWFGLPGIIFGPLLISYFIIMVKIYRSEYGPQGEQLELPLEVRDIDPSQEKKS